jgi:hypothetical protein
LKWWLYACTPVLRITRKRRRDGTIKKPIIITRRGNQEANKSPPRKEHARTQEILYEWCGRPTEEGTAQQVR